MKKIMLRTSDPWSVNESFVPSIENKTVGCWFELRALKTLYFYFCNLKEYKLKGFLQEIMKQNNTLNIRRLVDELFGPSTQHPAYHIEGCQISNY